jgi:hypothetical protein
MLHTSEWWLSRNANWMIILGCFNIQYGMTAVLCCQYNMAPHEDIKAMMQWVFGWNSTTLEKTSSWFQASLITLSTHLQSTIYELAWLLVHDAEEELLPDKKDTQATCESSTQPRTKPNGMIVETLSKHHKTITTSMYGSELVCMQAIV